MRGHPDALLYSTLEFRNFVRRAAGGEPAYLVAVGADGAIAGCLPCFAASDPELGTVLNSLPWYGSHGGCLVSDEDAREALLGRFAVDAADDRVLSATMILSPFEQGHLGDYAALLSPRATDVRIGQITQLPEAGAGVELRLERVLRQKTRNLVRKALKQGFVEAVDASDRAWRFLLETHASNMAAVSGKAKPWEHFAALREEIPSEWVRLSLALDEGRPVAALLLVAFNGTVEYLTPVVAPEARSRQPLSFLVWHAMLDAIDAGQRRWNWGGTWASQHSLHRFKAGFGADDLPYTYLVLASEAAPARIAAERERLARAFPYYYLYPFDLLDT